MIFNISDFYDKNFTMINKNIIPSYIVEEDYFININTEIDNCIELDYYDYTFISKIIKKSIENDENAVNIIQLIVRNMFIKNNYKYKGLYNTTNLEYNPIWNVDGTEKLEYTREVKHTGTQVNKGINNLIDSYNSKDTYENDTKLSKTTFNSNNLNLTDNNVDKSTNEKSGSDSHNTNIESTRTDNLNDNEKYTEVKERGGNIGTTMTQQLITAEREILNFSFLEIVCKDIIKEVCMLCG